MIVNTAAVNSGCNCETVWSRQRSLDLDWKRLKKVSLSKKPDAVMDKLNHRGKATV